MLAECWLRSRAAESFGQVGLGFERENRLAIKAISIVDDFLSQITQTGLLAHGCSSSWSKQESVREEIVNRNG
jgi:hypothetical protein